MIDQGPPSKSITADHGLEKEKENVRKISYVIRDLPLELHISGLWQYGSWSFQTGGTKLEIFLPKNQHTQRKGCYQKMSITKNVLLN